MPVEVTFFIPPYGKQTKQFISDIADEDAEWFTENNVKLSMEELMNGSKVIYADYGKKNEDGEPEEEMMVAMHRSCKSMMSELRIMTERALNTLKLNQGD